MESKVSKIDCGGLCRDVLVRYIKNQKQNKPTQKTLQKQKQQQKTKNPNHMIMIKKRMNQIVTIV